MSINCHSSVPLNCIVGFPMRISLLAIFFSFALSAYAQSLAAARAVTVRISSASETCFIGDEEIACIGVGQKLLDMHVPPNSQVHFSGDAKVTYDLVSSALESLRVGGYKVGYVVYNDE